MADATSLLTCPMCSSGSKEYGGCGARCVGARIRTQFESAQFVIDIKKVQHSSSSCCALKEHLSFLDIRSRHSPRMTFLIVNSPDKLSGSLSTVHSAFFCTFRLFLSAKSPLPRDGNFRIALILDDIKFKFSCDAHRDFIAKMKL